jgi:hypothetical protein
MAYGDTDVSAERLKGESLQASAMHDDNERWWHGHSFQTFATIIGATGLSAKGMKSQLTVCFLTPSSLHANITAHPACRRLEQEL